MTLEDLLTIGKLGNSKKAPGGYLRFKPDWNFRKYFLEIKDIFLVFPDYRVRYVTIEDIRHDSEIWIKLAEQDVYPEIAEYRSVQYRLPRIEIDSVRYENEPEYLNGMEVIYMGESLGVVSETINNGAHDLLLIDNERYRDLMIPQVEYYIINIDKQSKRILVRNIEGLIKL